MGKGRGPEKWTDLEKLGCKSINQEERDLRMRDATGTKDLYNCIQKVEIHPTGFEEPSSAEQ